METKLYVGNLSFSTTEDALRTLFSQAGSVTSAELIKDRDTGSSKGFAFITMGSQAEMEKAITTFNGYMLDNRELKVNIARPREERPRTGGYNSNYSSNRGGSSGGRTDTRNKNRGGSSGGSRRY
jgi:RNA recognition motif-containing protein